MAPILTDAFAPDAFSVYNLTAALDKIPLKPSYIDQLGLFRQIPINTTLVAVEENQGVLSLIPTTARGGPGIPGRDSNRKAHTFTIPHIQVDDTVLASDVLNTRSFGSQNAMSGVGEVVGRKLEIMKNSLEATQELARRGALNGKVYYPEDSIDADLDIFTSFGLTNQATDQLSVDFVWGTDTTKLMSTVIPTIRDNIETALGGTGYTGIVALCGRTFFRNLIGQGTIKALYEAQQAQWALSQVTLAPGITNRMQFQLQDVTFVEYYGKVGSSDGVGTDGLFQVAAEARAFPIGTDIFHSYIAPSDLTEAVGTNGIPYTANQYESLDGKRVHLSAQSNILNICTRPKALIRLHSST